MKVILCGYHWAGCKALELLLNEGHEVYVYTHKTENYVADLEGLCLKKDIAYSIEKITVDNLPFIPDIICSVYYRWIIKQDVINLVKGRIFNLHPTLLPKYCGCSSLTWEMINGEEQCGFTYHYIDEGYDSGNIIIQKTIQIEDFDTQLTLYNRVMFESMDFFLEALRLVEQGYEGKRQEVKTLREFQEILERGRGRIAVIGCGGHARSIVDTIQEINNKIEIVVVDSGAKEKEIILGCRVVQSYEIDANMGYIIAIGNNQKRCDLYQQMKVECKGYCISLIARRAYVGKRVKIGEGTFVASNAYIGPQAEIGNNTIINTGSVIEHEARIGNHTHIAPNATICGRSTVGDNVLIGAGSTVIDGISVCSGAIIGAGTVVTTDIEQQGKYVGTPARRIK